MAELFTTTTPVLEIVVRVTLVYFTLLVLVRCAGKREVGQLGPVDLLAMLVLSETVSPSLTAQDASLGAAMVAATTLLALSAVVGRLTYHSRTVERLVDGSARVIIEDGRLLEEVARAERITPAELAQSLRAEGIEDVGGVRRAVVEPNGTISVVPKR